MEKKKTPAIQDAQIVEAPVKAPVKAPTQAQAPQAPPVADKAPVVPGQDIETQAYVPNYKVLPEFKQAILNSIGDAPFNQIAGIMNAINVETMDHNTLTQVINVLGNFPYIKVEKLLATVNNYVEQIIDDE